MCCKRKKNAWEPGAVSESFSGGGPKEVVGWAVVCKNGGLVQSKVGCNHKLWEPI